MVDSKVGNIIVCGKKRTLYVGNKGGIFYRSKGAKVYVNKKKVEDMMNFGGWPQEDNRRDRALGDARRRAQRMDADARRPAQHRWTAPRSRHSEKQSLMDASRASAKQALPRPHPARHRPHPARMNSSRAAIEARQAARKAEYEAEEQRRAQHRLWI